MLFFLSCWITPAPRYIHTYIHTLNWLPDALFFRVCKRWHALSKDQSLWRNVDLSFQPLQAIQARQIVRERCKKQNTRRLALRAVDNRIERKKATKFSCKIMAKNNQKPEYDEVLTTTIVMLPINRLCDCHF
mgnify:CR=1 FL=1